MQDTHQIHRVLRTLEGLRVDILLMDQNGRTIPGGVEHVVPNLSDPSISEMPFQGYTWARVKASPIAFVATPGEDATAQDFAHLAAALVDATVQDTGLTDAGDFLRAVLREEVSGTELDALSAEQGIPIAENRCVILLHGLSSSMKELIDLSDDDYLVEMDRHATALIKSMSNMDDYDDLVEYAEAMEQTIMSETGEQPIISIGEIRPTLGELGASYRAAWRALEIGRIFQPSQNVFAFGRLILERYLSEIPRELGQRYYHLLFNRKTQRLFNDEMLYTIEMFFAKDLNLSDTARQLYIHRNTLVYRLDKVQRQTGLDLRKFTDAITFRTLLLLGKCGMDRPTVVW